MKHPRFFTGLKTPSLLLVVILLFLFVSSPCPALQTPPAGGCFVYPSPATGGSVWAVYNMTQVGIAHVRVYNEAGDLVVSVDQSQSAGVQQTWIDLSHLRKGIYLCRLSLEYNEGGKQVLKAFKFIVSP